MKAKQKDLDALNACIEEKWKPLSKEKGREEHCALCSVDNLRVYASDEPFSDCKRCIIARDTGELMCSGTPYYNWRDESEQSTEAAKEMLEYLEKLRDKLEISDDI